MSNPEAITRFVGLDETRTAEAVETDPHTKPEGFSKMLKRYSSDEKP